MKKKIISVLLVGIIMFAMVGCSGEPTVDDKQKQETERLMNEMQNQVGMPDITNFFERKMAKDIFELRDDSELITYAYTQNLDGKYVYLGQAVGFGLPYSVQYTNPERRIGDGIDGEIATIPQADPNGLFMPEGLSATWLMLINEETGEREIIYTEPSIVVTQSKLPRRLVAEWSLPDNY